MGNVYDESWAGIFSNMISTITNASTSSILNSAFETGRHHAYNAVANAINPKNIITKVRLHSFSVLFRNLK